MLYFARVSRLLGRLVWTCHGYVNFRVQGLPQTFALLKSCCESSVERAVLGGPFLPWWCV